MVVCKEQKVITDKVFFPSLLERDLYNIVVPLCITLQVFPIFFFLTQNTVQLTQKSQDGECGEGKHNTNWHI